MTLLMTCAAHAGTEIYPGEFVALPVGTQVLSFYQYQRYFEGYYFKGHRKGNANVTGHASVAAYTHYGQLGGMTSAWSVTLPYIEAHKTAGTLPSWFGNQTSGWSDLRLKYSLWPVNDPERGRYVALAGIWQPNTGKYENTQVLNPGDSRNRFTFQLAWIEPLAKTLSLELIPELSVQSSNSDYVGTYMKQEKAYALTSYLRWNFAGPWTASVGFQNNGGGDQVINGMRQNNQPDQKRVLLGISALLATDIAASLRYSHDLSIQNSLRIDDDWVLAMHWLF
jgi:hypothetical protein